VLRIEPVGAPAGVDPDDPDRHVEQRHLEDPERRRMSGQRVGELDDREDEDQVEEQFDEGNLAVVVVAAIARAQMRDGGAEGHGGSYRDAPKAQRRTAAYGPKLIEVTP
jgi:hypothetical protein